jgi:hypothetical protein
VAQLPAGRDAECSSLGDGGGGSPACCAPFVDLDLLLRIISWTLDLRNIARRKLCSSARTHTEENNSVPESREEPPIEQLREQSKETRELLLNYYLRFALECEGTPLGTNRRARRRRRGVWERATGGGW